MNGFTDTVFASNTVSKPHDGRYNVLLMGTDSGNDRIGMRPDSINVASIDADTGKAGASSACPATCENVPFPKGSVMREQFPNGFDCDGCYLNAVNTWANDHADLFYDEGARHRRHDGRRRADHGPQAQLLRAGQHEGLLQAHRRRRRREDQRARAHRDRRHRLARSAATSRPASRSSRATRRSGTPARRVENDDWSRMGRQKCVMNAMVRQLNPQKVILNMQDIANSSSAMLHTSIPRQDLNVFMDLALKTKSQPISSVSLVPPVIYTGNPDFDKVRRLVVGRRGLVRGAATSRRRRRSSRRSCRRSRSAAEAEEEGSAQGQPQRRPRREPADATPTMTRAAGTPAGLMGRRSQPRSAQSGEGTA